MPNSAPSQSLSGSPAEAGAHLHGVNSSAAKPFADALRAIAVGPALQSRFLNTLSLLEYIGARKILKSQPAECMSLQLLTHAAEELRHAKALKGIAERLNAGTPLGYAAAETLCGIQARAYFQTLDDRVAERIGAANPRMVYLYETLLIEERALWVYPKLMVAFENPWVVAVCRAILAEEDRHLAEMQAQIAAADAAHSKHLVEFRAFEEDLFATFARALRAQAQGETGLGTGTSAATA